MSVISRYFHLNQCFKWFRNFQTCYNLVILMCWIEYFQIKYPRVLDFFCLLNTKGLHFIFEQLNVIFLILLEFFILFLILIFKQESNQNPPFYLSYLIELNFIFRNFFYLLLYHYLKLYKYWIHLSQIHLWNSSWFNL